MAFPLGRLPDLPPPLCLLFSFVPPITLNNERSRCSVIIEKEKESGREKWKDPVALHSSVEVVTLRNECRQVLWPLRFLP